MESQQLPVIDWKLAAERTGNDIQLAKKMLGLLLVTLSDDILAIRDCYEKKDYQQLLKQVHRLHGALCYCGLPRLNAAVTTLEQALKENKIANVPFLLIQAEMEADRVMHAGETRSHFEQVH